MSNAVPLPEPYGRITTHTITGQQFFYRWPESPYLDNAKECIEVVTYHDLHAHAAAVSAAKDARIKESEDALRSADAAFEAVEIFLPDGCKEEFAFYAAWEDVRAALGDKMPNAVVTGAGTASG